MKYKVSFDGKWLSRFALLALLGVLFALPAAAPAIGNQKAAGIAPPGRTKPGPLANSSRAAVLYTGRGRDIKRVSFRLRGHELIEATIVYFESCTKTGLGHRRRNRRRTKLELASRRSPLRVDGRGRFHEFFSEQFPSENETQFFAGKVTPQSIVGRFSLEWDGSPPESGHYAECHTGPFGGPTKELTFHARRAPAI